MEASPDLRQQPCLQWRVIQIIRDKKILSGHGSTNRIYNHFTQIICYSPVPFPTPWSRCALSHLTKCRRSFIPFTTCLFLVFCEAILQCMSTINKENLWQISYQTERRRNYSFSPSKLHVPNIQADT